MAQSVTSLLQGRAQGQEPTPATADPLGRETPSGTVLGFLQAAQFGNYKTASDYLQISAARRPSQGADLAQKLKVLMDRAFVTGLRRLSTSPEGNPEYGTPDQQTIGTFSSGEAEIPVVLVGVSRYEMLLRGGQHVVAVADHLHRAGLARHAGAVEYSAAHGRSF